MLRKTSGLCAALALASCGSAPEQVEPTSTAADAIQTASDGPRPQLGLMTSLPLYWPLGAEFSELASGQAEIPWQRGQIEQTHEIVLLDTLTPIPGLTADAPETDPLEGLSRLAVVQPRGLSPADNVALDGWVRAGGQLLLVLDPMLTGHYELALGDPRRPTDTALIPPVVNRWGLDVTYEDDGAHEVRPERVSDGGLTLIAALAGEVSIVDPGAAECELLAENIVARCRVGDGRIVLIADATMFETMVEQASATPTEGTQLARLLSYAFDE